MGTAAWGPIVRADSRWNLSGRACVDEVWRARICLGGCGVYLCVVRCALFRGEGGAGDRNGEIASACGFVARLVGGYWVHVRAALCTRRWHYLDCGQVNCGAGRWVNACMCCM